MWSVECRLNHVCTVAGSLAKGKGKGASGLPEKQPLSYPGKQQS